MRRIIIGGGLGLLGLVLAFAAGELVVRRFFPQEHLPPDIFVSDPILGYRVAPRYNGIHATRIGPIPLVTNSLSMRDREYGPPAPGERRVYFLGDSFIFGNRVAVEDTVTKVLEHRLRERFGAGMVVINAGMPGYSTFQELTYLEQTIAALQPEVVLLGMCVGNDLWDNLMYSTRNTAEGGRGAWRGGTGGLRARLTLLLKRSDFYLLIRRTFNDTFRKKEADETHGRVAPEQTDEVLRLTEEVVVKMGALAQQHGVRFAVLLIAVPDSVYPLDEQRELNRRFTEYLRERGVEVFDLLPDFEAHAGEELYYTVHWTPRGHAVVADAALDFLLQKRWLDEGAR